MVELCLILIYIISFFKPEILVDNNLKNEVDDNEKSIIIKTNRRLYLLIILGLEFFGTIVNLESDIYYYALIILSLIIISIVFLSRKLFKQKQEIVNKYKKNK